MKFPFITNTNGLIVFLILSVSLSCTDSKKKNDKKPARDFKYTNELIQETSPYLLDHAHNPVNWQPWSEEALNRAKEEHKLVIISIGYSSCHWCHVMEEETFENEEVAQVMNENFINIKVDREERPDIDEVYMTAINLIKGTGGWPLNVIALPNGKPIYTGTYHTKKEWESVLKKINSSYKSHPEKAEQYANMVAEGIQEANFLPVEENSGEFAKKKLFANVEQWSKNWDIENGGDKGQQKFMLPSTMDFLMDYGLLKEDNQALQHFKITLKKMSSGGVYDHVGGGFFRYSTDTNWEIPHYEKMLYDNAQLLGLFSKAYRKFKDPSYKETALGILTFLNKTMKNPEGGFYSAIDADSDGQEGEFYIWKKQELQNILKDDFKLFSRYFRLIPENKEGNSYILTKTSSDSVFRKENDISEKEFKQKKANWISQLSAARKQRTHPDIDDKIITSWNAILVNSLTEAYMAFGNPDYLKMAKNLHQELLQKAYRNGKLIHSYKKNNKAVSGFLDDYAYLINASINLYSVTADLSYLDLAKELTQHVEKNFPSSSSELFNYSENAKLISNVLKSDDGVLPSPNSVMAENLFLLGHIFYEKDWLEKSEKMLATMVPLIEENPSAYANWNHLYLKNTFNFFEVAIVGEKATSVLKDFFHNYHPNSITLGSQTESDLALFEERFRKGETYIYVCENRSCKMPVTTVKEAEALIEDSRN